MADPILRTEGLSRHFGGLAAVNRVSLAIKPRGVHAIIGPNGAGKSTMVNLLSGHLLPTEGTIRFDGRDITRLPAHQVARLGVGRSFQRTNIFPSFTCLENCWLAAQTMLKSSLRFFRPAGQLKPVRVQAEQALELCGLAARADTIAADMSYGEQRQLEIAMVLATRPRFLLLDEPMAGMGQEESQRVVELLRGLAEDYPLVLVEHDMDAVFSIAEELTVMVDGHVLASGPLDAVRDDAAVQEAYLGDGEEIS
jgi:branched-chain amino acid transport system ATP-binding protein